MSDLRLINNNSRCVDARTAPLYDEDIERAAGARPYPHLEAFDNPLGRIALAMNPTTEADPVGVMGSLIAATATALGPDVRVSVQDFDHPLLAWFILCGPTSTGRKGTAEGVAHRVLSLAMPEFMQTNVVSGLSSGEGLIQAVADRDADDPSPPGRTDDKRRLVLEDEYATLLSRARRDGNTITPVLRQAWDGRNLQVLTRNQLLATRPHIGVVGHITPDEFKDRLSARDLAGGSYNRFLPLFVRRSKSLPRGGGADPELVLTLAADLEERIIGACSIPLARGAQDTDAWVSIYHEFFEIEEDPALSKWVSRATPYVLRLAGLYAVLDGTALVRDEHLWAAAHLVRYSHDSIRHILAPSIPNYVEMVARAIQQSGDKGLMRSELTSKFSGRIKAAELTEIVAHLTELDEYTVEHNKSTGGRPSSVVRYRAA